MGISWQIGYSRLLYQGLQVSAGFAIKGAEMTMIKAG